MAKTPKPTDYESLRKIWYAKLKKTGFVDAESTAIRFNWATADFARERSMKSWEAKQEYYIMAEHFLNEYKFKSNFERIIWEYHTNGMSARNILKTLKKAKVTDLKHHDSIADVTVRLRKIMFAQYMDARVVHE